jgi:hypothetical protein
MDGETNRAARSLLDRMLMLRALNEQPGYLSHASKASFVHQIATDLGILLRLGPSGERLAELDRALAALYARDELARGIRGDTLWRYEALRGIWEGRGLSIAGIVLRPLIRRQTAALLETAAAALAAARLPWPENISRLREIPELDPIGPPAVRFLAGWREAPQFPLRLAEAIAAARCARLAIAADQFRRATERLPDTLDELELGADERLDPLTGESLRYARREDGFVVYSVGSDLMDERGRLSADATPGRMPDTLPRPDVGVNVTYPVARSPGTPR